MDNSAAPWRALEAPPGSAGAEPVAVEGRRSLAAVAAVVAAGALAVGAFFVAAGSADPTIELDSGAQSSASGSLGPVAELVVEVKGAVATPGVYRLPAGARVVDAVTAAGGFGPRVDADRAEVELNLAALLSDGQAIVVPSRDDPAGAAGTAGPAPGEGGIGSDRIDLNRATAEQLDSLPGVGPVTVQKILDARAERPFAAVDELRTREVVGQATFEKIRDLVAVG